jgi:hypothetical protein
VREAHWEEQDFDDVLWLGGRLSWSPDGKLLAFSDLMNSHQFLCYRSIRSGFADSLCRRVWTVITIPHFPRMVKRWPSIDVCQSARRGFRGATNTVSALALNTAGVWPGPQTGAILFRKGCLACKCRLALEDISSLLCAYG